MRKLSELKISPAPWRFIHDDVVDSLECGVVYSCDCSYLGVADGNLIAASPKMYECLHEAVVDMCNYCADFKNGVCRSASKTCYVQKWRAALAEAAGEEVPDGR